MRELSPSFYFDVGKVSYCLIMSWKRFQLHGHMRQSEHIYKLERSDGLQLYIWTPEHSEYSTMCKCFLLKTHQLTLHVDAS